MALRQKNLQAIVWKSGSPVEQDDFSRAATHVLRKETQSYTVGSLFNSCYLTLQEVPELHELAQRETGGAHPEYAIQGCSNPPSRSQP